MPPADHSAGGFLFRGTDMNTTAWRRDRVWIDQRRIMNPKLNSSDPGNSLGVIVFHA